MFSKPCVYANADKDKIFKLYGVQLFRHSYKNNVKHLKHTLQSRSTLWLNVLLLYKIYPFVSNSYHILQMLQT